MPRRKETAPSRVGISGPKSLVVGGWQRALAASLQIKSLVDEAGVPKYGMHSLRHACASLWIEGGYNPKQIQRLMGHSSIKVTFDVYGHLFSDAEADQRAAEGVQMRLLGG